VSLSAATGNGVWDGIGTTAIGVLLISVAAVLVVETKSLLLGESASPEANERIAGALVEGGDISRVIHLRTMHLGPEELLVGAKIAVRPEATFAEVAKVIDAAEARVRAAEPAARVIYLEPDVDRG
jgi:divalent metal cation (Fe/Co/Zn/Cd) transporter